MNYGKKMKELIAERDRRIVVMAREGISHDDIARVYEISRVRVTQIINEAKRAEEE